MSRRFLPLVLAATLVGTLAAGSLADFGGRWEVVVQGPEGALPSVLQIEQKGDSVNGTLESEMGTARLAGSTKGDSIKFAFSMDAGGQLLNLLAVGALKDKNHIVGKIIAEGMGDFPFTGERK